MGRQQPNEQITNGSRNEDPMPTRWSFEDFERVYEILFGREKDISVQGIDNTTEVNGLASIDGPTNSSNSGDQTQNEDPAAPQGSASLSTTNRGRASKPPLQYYTNDMQELAENITRDILQGDLNVRWEDIKGLGTAKKLLKEAVVMPIKYPQYFTGLLAPWKGVLLFGPPGTGKTMLAKAVATECNTTFFNISASSIVSKWRGDSEKLIRVLFELARHHAPSTIFLDELDAIIGQRGEGKEHEASRRLKTELLVQMDGLAKTEDLVFVLAATNLPWELDSAMLRRLEKRILVPLPEPEARQAMYEALLPTREGQEELPYEFMVEATEGYSGSDIRLVCKEAAMWPLRRVLKELEAREETSDMEAEMPRLGPVTEEDVQNALKATRSSAHAHTALYKKFETEYGSHTM